MGAYVRDIWRGRFFWMSLVRMDLRLRYRRSILGIGWSLLNPLVMTIILCVVFQRFWKEPPEQAGPRIISALVCWNFIVVATCQGCQCLFQGESYIRQYPAPIAIYPLRTTLGALIHFLMAFVVVVSMSWVLLGFGSVSSLASLLPATLLLFLMGWALAVLAGFANVYFQDTQHLCDVAFQMLFYATPIIYREDILGPAHGPGASRLRKLVHMNPLSSFIELFREPILNGQPASVHAFQVAALTVAALGALAILTLKRLQRSFIFHL
jgi:ABC-type polysaccharide/polyol phosphate export permease